MTSRLSISTLVILALLNVVNSEYEVVKIFTDQNDKELSWRYTLNDGTTVNETRYKKTLEDGRKTLTVSGFYGYISPEGILHRVHYNADENGYRPRVIVASPSEPRDITDPVTNASPQSVQFPTKHRTSPKPPVYDAYIPEEGTTETAIDLKLLNILTNTAG